MPTRFDSHARGPARLYDLRIELGLTHEQLASEVGLHADTIRNLESGKRPSTRTAHQLTKFFSVEFGRIVPASELFGPPLVLVHDNDPEAAA